MEVIGTWPDGLAPRIWQEEARAKFESRVVLGSKDDFLCATTSGGGKTLFALIGAYQSHSEGSRD